MHASSSSVPFNVILNNVPVQRVNVVYKSSAMIMWMASTKELDFSFDFLFSFYSFFFAINSINF